MSLKEQLAQEAAAVHRVNGAALDLREYGIEENSAARPAANEVAGDDGCRTFDDAVHLWPPREPGEDPVEPEHQFDDTKRAHQRFEILTAKELASGDFAGVYIVEDLLAWLEFCILVGPKKSLKTTLALYLACCIAIGRPVFGIFKVQELLRVGFFSGESGAGTLQDAMRRIATYLGRSAGDFENLVFCFDVPRLDSQADIETLERIIRERELRVVFLDCFYRMLASAADDVANVFKMGSLLAALMDLQRRTGCTIVLLHHTPKHAPYAEPELDNAAYAGISEAARQWILLARRCPYDAEQPGHHELWFSVGGSMGHTELLALNIDEGSRKDPGGRRFDLEVISAGEARAEAFALDDEAKEARRKSRKETELQQDRETICGILQTMSKPDTHTEVRSLTALSTPRFAKAIGSLTADKTVMVLAGAVEKGNKRFYDGYWLASRKDQIPQRAATGSNGQPDTARCVASQQATPSIEGLPDACVQAVCESNPTDAKAAGCEVEAIV